LKNFDFVLIGGGIVGTATAWKLKQRYPDATILLIEKESSVAGHQTGHNSGVIHAGVYYAPGSLKADFCKRGASLTLAFCREHNLPYELCGKLLVATDDTEFNRMAALEERCRQNGIGAAAVSMDGYILPCTRHTIPIVWRIAFPDDIRRHVESQGNVITNSDVEAIAAFVFECMIDDVVQGRTEGISTFLWSNNTPTVSWLLRYSSKATSRVPEAILRLLALRHRWNRRGPHDIQHWPGKRNLMPDFASRSYEQGF